MFPPTLLSIVALMDNVPALIFGIVLVAILIVGGVLAYTGRYKGWLLLKPIFPGWLGLDQLYLGVGIAMILLYSVVGDRLPPLVVLLAVAVAGMVVGVVGMFWLPSFLPPAWIKRTRERMRRGEDALSQAMRPGGALYGRLGVPPEQWPSDEQVEQDRRRLERIEKIEKDE